MVERLDQLLQCCTVKVTVPGHGWGTGFFVAPGLILTCAHVVRALKPDAIAQISWQQQEGFAEAAIVERIPELDLALLQFSPPTTIELPCVYLGEGYQPRDDFYTFGYPDSFPQGTSVTASCEGPAIENGSPLIVFKLARIRPGLSGSPLLNLNTGKVCGMVKFTHDRSIALGGGAVPACVILEQFQGFKLSQLQQQFHQQDQRWFQRMEIQSNSATLPSTRATLSLSAYDPGTWVGRDSLVTNLCQTLKDGCRILALTGITGIGKTALAERLVVEVSKNGIPFHRLNFDDRGQGRDFLSGALALLPKLGEMVTPEDQKDSQNALNHLLHTLQNKPFLVQIDSLEMLLQGDEQTGWNTFTDPLWLDFFQRLLAGSTCQSQILLTTQAIPEELETIGDRYRRCWYCQDVNGLSGTEQIKLFEKNGLRLDDLATETLKRIGKLYQGHPLVIQVIAKDILDKPFNGNVQKYWQRYQAEFDEMERDRRQKGSSPRSLQLRVKQRVEQSLKRLPADAYRMLCRSSVYRRSVPEEFWLAMMKNLPEDKQGAALELLKSHNLAEEELRTDGILLLRQHNLVRSVARQLLKIDETMWRTAERTAAEAWLNDYEPEPNASNLEQVRGLLEAFYHFCELEDWEQAEGVPFTQLNTSNQEVLHHQLGIWGYYQEQIGLYSTLLEVFRKTSNRRGEGFALGNLGSAYDVLGNYQQALDYYQQHLEIARELNHRKDEGSIVNNLATIYHALNDYHRATEYYQQALTVVQETGNRWAEGIILDNLGSIFSILGNYEQAIDYHQQALTTVRETENRQSEQAVLNSLGEVHYLLGDYGQALKYYQQALTITQKLGNRRSEGRILGNLGLVDHAWGDYDQAIAYHQQGLAIANEIGDRQGQGMALCNLGFALHFLGDYDQAMENLQLSLTIAREIGDQHGEATTLGNIGRVFHALEKYQQATDCHQQRLTIARKIGDLRGEGIAQMQLGAALIKLENYSDAQPLLQSALKICRKIGNRSEEAETLLLLAQLHYQMGELHSVHQFCEESLQIAELLEIPLTKAILELSEQMQN